MNSKWIPNHFSVPRWNWTGSIGCTTSWPNSVWRRPPTSTLAQCLWDARCHRAATSSSPPPSSLRHWGNSWSEFSQISTQDAGTCDHDGGVMSKQWRCVSECESTHILKWSGLRSPWRENGNTAVLCLFTSDTGGWMLSKESTQMSVLENWDYKIVFTLKHV